MISLLGRWRSRTVEVAIQLARHWEAHLNDCVRHIYPQVDERGLNVNGIKSADVYQVRLNESPEQRDTMLRNNAVRGVRDASRSRRRLLKGDARKGARPWNGAL